MINDSISDFLTRIRNANLVCREKVLVPSTKINKRLAKILVRHGFISDFQQINKPSTKKLNKILRNKVLKGSAARRQAGARAKRGPAVLRQVNGKSLILTLKYKKNTANKTAARGLSQRKSAALALRSGPRPGVILQLQRLSRPGCRLYVRARNLPQICGKLGIVLLSTSKGILSDREASSLNVGGEFLGFIL